MSCIQISPAVGESDDPSHERAAVQRLRRAHSATLHAMERAGRRGKLLGAALRSHWCRWESDCQGSEICCPQYKATVTWMRLLRPRRIPEAE